MPIPHATIAAVTAAQVRPTVVMPEMYDGLPRRCRRSPELLPARRRPAAGSPGPKGQLNDTITAPSRSPRGLKSPYKIRVFGQVSGRPDQNLAARGTITPWSPRG